MLIHFMDKLGFQTVKTENGQDLAEYAVFIGLIALLVIVSITIIGGSISEIFTSLANAITDGL
jgi:Flp pilus assembly pilin Flp